MNDFRTRLTLDNTDFSRQMDDAASSVNQFQKQTSDASKTVDDMGKATKRTASELLKQMKSMEGGARSVSNYRQQLGQMIRQLQDLRINYNGMSDDIKNSDFGREVAAQIQDLTKKAAQYKDEIQDATNATKLLSSDTANLDAFKSGLDGIGAAMQLFASTAILGEENTEKVVKALAKLKAIESATSAVIKIANTFNKDNILMLKLRTIWTNAQTKAQVANNTATNAGSKAVKTLTVAIKSCPYALVATAIVAIVAAYISWSEKTHQQIEMQRKLGRRLDEDTESFKKYGDTVGGSIGKAVSQFERLERKYKALETFKDKEKFLKDYAKEMENLGLHAKNVNDLEDIYINKVDDYKAAVQMKAEYLALQGLIEEAYADYYKRAATASQQGKRYQKGDRLTNIQEYFDLQSLVEGVDYTVIDRDFYGKIVAELTGSGAKKMSNAMTQTFNEAAGEGARQAVQTYIDRLNEIDDDPRYKKLFNNNPETTPTSNTSSTPTAKEGSLAWYDSQIQALQNLIKNEKLSQQEFEEINKKIEELEKNKLEYVQSLRGGVLELIPTLKPISTDEALMKLQEYYDKHPLEIKTEPKMTSFEAFEGTVNGFASINNSIKSVYDTWSKLSESLADKNGFESMLTIIGAVLSTLQSICSVIETINTLTEIMNALGLITYKTQQKKNMATTAGLAPEAMAVGLAEKEATAASVGAAAEGGKSVAKIPYVGAFLAIAMIAAILGALLSAKSSMKFAKGGIVPGSSFSGDNITAQLNSGEMVLNTQQQARLFDMLNGNSPFMTSNNVRFEIEGQKLVGVIDNYNRKLSHI